MQAIASIRKNKATILRIGILIIVMFIVLAIPTMLIGDRFELLLDGEKAVTFLRSQGAWAAVIGVGAIMADLIIPVPAQAVMTALGLLYGAIAGGLMASLGTFLSGYSAYWLCRVFGRRAATFIAGERDLVKMEAFFARFGFWAIAGSRWLPVVPEVLSSLAGVTRMRQSHFVTSTLIGSVSVGFAYATFGALELTSPAAALGIAFVIPMLLLPVFLLVVRRSSRKGGSAK